MLGIDLIDNAELKSAIKSLNDSNVLDEKIKVGGKSKEEQVKLFIDGITKLIEEDGLEMVSNELPGDVIELFNLIMADEEDATEKSKGEIDEEINTPVETPVKTKKTEATSKPTKEKEKIETKKETKPHTLPLVPPSVIRPRLIALVKEGKYTQAQIVDIMVKEFPEKAKSTFVTYLNDGKSEKYFMNLDKEGKKQIKVNPDTKIMSW